jgi:hypothetical protein
MEIRQATRDRAKTMEAEARADSGAKLGEHSTKRGRPGETKDRF